jgi:hypothetical protein
MEKIKIEKIKIKSVVMSSVFLISILMLSFVFGCSGAKEVAITEDISSNPVLGDSSSQSEEELICPLRIGSEPAPGTCPLYRDENNDGFCDFKK